jgi:serine/threonine protein kinase
MQWIEGQNLKQVIDRDGRLAPDRAVRIAIQLAGALDALHGVAGLVHRDIKPANVLLGEVAGSDHAYLTDFGVAKPSDSIDHLTQTGWVVGTAGYLSPEQIRGEEPGPRSDLYALGCVLFEALTGRPPFRAQNEMALRWAHANDPRPTASGVIPALRERYDEFLASALAVDPAQRFGSGREFAERLASAHAADPTTTTQPIVPSHTPTAVGPPTPLPPRATPPPGGQPYHAYGYVTPPPAPAHSNRSGSPMALILLGLVALVGISVGALAAGGVFSHAASTRRVATNLAITPPTTTTTTTRTTTTTSTTTTSVIPSQQLTHCDPNISVDAHTTSCRFAENVFYEYWRSHQNPSGQLMTVYSPVTLGTYRVTCTPDQQQMIACTTKTRSYVTFSQAAVAAYTPAEANYYAHHADLGHSTPYG